MPPYADPAALRLVASVLGSDVEGPPDDLAFEDLLAMDDDAYAAWRRRVLPTFAELDAMLTAGGNRLCS